MKPVLEQMADFDARRSIAKVTDKQLSEVSGIPQANISRYRHGVTDPTMTRWIRLNNALDTLIAERVAELRKLA